MKKVIVLVLSLVAMVLTVGVTNSYAATPSESVIANLQKGATNANGFKIQTTAYDITQAQNYVNATPLTTTQAAIVNGYIDNARAVLANGTANNGSIADNYNSLSATNKKLITADVENAASELNLSVTWGTGANADGFALVSRKSGTTVYKPSSTNGGSGYTTIVKQTGMNYQIAFVTLGALVMIALGGFVISRKYQATAGL